jgi:hypothetical protein
MGQKQQERITMQLSKRETAIVLAALRIAMKDCYAMGQMPQMKDEDEPTPECTEIDELCMKINGSANDSLDPWADCSDYPREDWKYEVANGDTSLGYWDWVENLKATNSESVISRTKRPQKRSST